MLNLKKIGVLVVCLIASLFIMTSCKITINPASTESNTTSQSSTGSTQIITSTDNADAIYSVSMDGSNTITYDRNQNVLDTLQLDQTVTLTSLMEENNVYYAFGSNNGNPFIQCFTIQDGTFAMDNTAYTDTSNQGTITNLTFHDYYIAATIDQQGTTITQSYIQNNDQFVPFFKMQIQYNYYEGMTIVPKYLVIHETDNTAAGADANAHYRYWNGSDAAQASTHFVVDSNKVYQMLQLDQAAWDVGDNKNYSDITNFNSIAIEICVNSDGNYAVARQNAIDLAIQVMNSLHMNISQLVRHYDASGKWCPRTMLDHPELWTDFVNQVEQGLDN